MTYESPFITQIGTFQIDTTDNRRFWSIDWHITGRA